jgi:hypothetical protein
LEVTSGDGIWMTVARCDHVELLRQRDEDKKLWQSCGLASRSPWWCRPGPAIELNVGGAQFFLRAATALHGSVLTGLRRVPITRGRRRQALSAKGAAVAGG